MKTQVILTMKENKRVIVMQEVIAGKKTVAEAARDLGLSERQGWRVLVRVREKGAMGVAK
ncbi:MAG: helix-turn-helix domain-containing protein [Deltaproteobacteria bacterium]|nr:helix-turn-helix domain-containing protein [Deltaproteobacteria bacterium]